VRSSFAESRPEECVEAALVFRRLEDDRLGVVGSFDDPRLDGSAVRIDRCREIVRVGRGET
jgi:hypothetical protein